ncbi:PAS domain S-box protein [Coleofasciculus sp. FACHB-1120]|uniref:PAS domain S-box protein n=1 Tax=Coleofasciculus sp. FACHB-1120 TaxID=2692783 RepID=UPI001689B6BB|nr:PAS domain S-box protein [Coleofasciculus sp. FACHB-1120]MBD2740273.1 PAS domain S-box protein [Coleofasciculus sp. FACHB-1120]
MLKFVQNFLSKDFIPHGHCYLWKPGLVWLHITSDILIAVAYYSIPIMLVYFVSKRRDMPFYGIFLLFGTFIVACGTTHLAEVVTLWHPYYWLSGFLKAFTAGVSVYTALVLMPLIPQALAFPSPALLEIANNTLEKEVAERQATEEKLRKLTLELERRVEERTAALQSANILLQQEIVERQQTEAALRESEAQYRRIVETTTEGIWVLDTAGNTSFANNQMAQMLGYTVPEMLGQTLFAFMDEEAQAIAIAHMERRRQGIKEQHDFKFSRKDGANLWAIVATNPIFDQSGQYIGVLGMITDITERKTAEEALRQSEAQLRQQTNQLEQAFRELQQTQAKLVQSEKMSSLGQLVAGIAHEINNPVNFIYGNLTHTNDYTQELLNLLSLYEKHYPNPVPEIQALLEMSDFQFMKNDLPKLLASIKVGAERIRQIVLSLRNFSRLDEAEMKSVDIHEGIENTLLILQHRLKQVGGTSGVQLLKEYGELPQIECYPGQLNQVFMNILTNAIDALEEAIGNGSWVMNDEKQRTHEQLPTIRIRTQMLNSNQLAIYIADNGSGISKEVQQRVFDPFFTTKSIGKGTGLGLSISYQIVEKHGGQLKCISSAGLGAEFAIEIPIHQTRRQPTLVKESTLFLAP